MTTARVLEPEWLDELPHEDPRAMRSRRDLVRVNGLMGNVGVVASELSRLGSLRSIAEIGAGDGAFMRAVLGRLDARDIEVHLVDRVTPGAAAAAMARGPITCVTADVFDWLAEGPRLDAIVANLFLHHFDDGQLRRMLALVSGRTSTFIACEPRRSSFALAGSHLLGFVGCNDVTRHDAVVSVRAGFAGHEISALWPATPGWGLEERARGLFSHSFVAHLDD
jgi:hypothetical protein